ncbi:hypothetical protein [Corynebacterium sp.]|uniref:hypothetical protein n=1 Tax=Corynebacterium sp. TaxID=1720 RepID=UPI0026DD3C8C|nr:hypothetical protein [Corynebacterium sp.]MDO5031489.1 hypothetical protein [Corynebacterium sp.]
MNIVKKLKKRTGLKRVVATAAVAAALVGGQAVAQAGESVPVTQGQKILTAEGRTCTVGYVEPSRAWTSAHCGLSGQQIYNERGQHVGTLRWFSPSGAAGHDLAYIQFAGGTYAAGNPKTGDGINPVPGDNTTVCVHGRLTGNDCATTVPGPQVFPGMHYSTGLPKLNGDSGSGVYVPGRPGVVGIYQGMTIATRGAEKHVFANYARMPYPNELAGLRHQGFVPRRPNIAPPATPWELANHEFRSIQEQAEGIGVTSSEGFGIEAVRGIANNYGLMI